MKKTISSNELHGMIAKCVGEVLAESRQKQTPRNTQKRVLTESQLQSYIQDVINEEMEKEGFKGKLRGAWNGIKQAASGEWDKAKRGITQTGLDNEYNGQSFKDRIKTAKETTQQYAKSYDQEEEIKKYASQLEQMADSGYFDEKQKETLLSLKNTFLRRAARLKGNATQAFNQNY